MEIFTSFADIPRSLQGAVIVIGNFDGVHLGHAALLREARAMARGSDRAFGVLTFEPHPRRLFKPDEAPGRITPPDLKAERLTAEGVDFLASVPFDWDFASQSAESFIQDILIDGLKASHVIVGADFRFGQLRKGDPAMIEAAGIGVTAIDKVCGGAGDVFSSSDVRQALRGGDVAAANAILGWKWEVRGIVVKGDQRGRELGYPTANLKLEETIHPAYGIYAARVQIVGEDEWFESAVNIGIRPMFEVPVGQVEAHILDFDRDIYGRILRVQLVKRLRGEAKFNSLEELIAQIDLDCEQARSVLGSV